MQQCPNCGHYNRAGVVFCENCGASLIGKKPLETKSLDSSSEEERAAMGIDASVLTEVKVQGTAVFEEGSSLRLEIEGSPDPILFKPKPETIFGRRDPATGAMPDIDLTPFAGYRMGVSRRHSAIRFGEERTLDIWDLGSSNGTFLNGQRLSAHRPYRLHDGDELRLGQMIIRIHFQPAEKTPETVPPTEPEGAKPAGTPVVAPVAPAPPPAPEASAVEVKPPDQKPEPPPETVRVEDSANPPPASSVSMPPPTAETPPLEDIIKPSEEEAKPAAAEDKPESPAPENEQKRD